MAYLVSGSSPTTKRGGKDDDSMEPMECNHHWKTLEGENIKQHSSNSSVMVIDCVHICKSRYRAIAIYKAIGATCWRLSAVRKLSHKYLQWADGSHFIKLHLHISIALVF
jgi:hypothetical protein